MPELIGILLFVLLAFFTFSGLFEKRRANFKLLIATRILIIVLLAVHLWLSDHITSFSLAVAAIIVIQLVYDTFIKLRKIQKATN